MNFLKFLVVALVIMVGSASAATLTLTTKYGATGGLAGDLNSVGDQVDGRDICPAVNDYANNTPGCDMSGDAGYSDNGTGNPSDDFYTGDLIVRTNDSFEVVAKYSWLGNAGGDEEQVTITGTLPTGKGFIWDDIPGACNQTLSSLSSDRKIITCIRKDFDSNDVGSYSELLAFAVKVEGDAVNGSVPGDIVFSIEEPTGTAGTQTDGVEDGKATNLLKVTASPRWNIDKHDGAGYYTTSYGVTDDNGNPGWYIWYNFTIEVDEVPGEADTPINPSLGNEALKGGTDATVSFTDDLSQISPHAKLVTWDNNGNFSPTSNACDMDTYTNGDEPYPAYNATYPDRSISVPAGTMGVTCTQNGTSVAVTVTGIDGTLTNAPIKNRNGGLLPVTRKIAAIGVMRVFVPLSDVEAGEDNIDGTADDGQLTTTNCLTDFNPVGISNGANFNGVGESEADNCRDITLYAARGGWSKSYRRGWSDQADQIAEWGGEGWWLPPTDASLVMSGDGSATPGSVWGTYTVYQNTGGTDIANPMICDVIDVETYKMVLLDPNTDNPATFVDDTKQAVDLNYGTTETVPGIKVEYATGYVGSWPPDPDVAAGYAVASECNDTSITWYPDLLAAEASGQPVSKVRISAPTLPVQKLMAMRIKHEARSTYLTSGDPIPNNQLLVNYATYKSALTNDKYISNRYQPHNASTNHEGGWSGDRLIMQRAKVRILKDMTPTAVSPGSEVIVTLRSSFTTDGPSPENSNVQIVDVLPKGLDYKVGSTIGTYGGSATPYGEPQVFVSPTDAECNTYAAAVVAQGHPCGTLNGGTGDETILVWDLGSQTTGTVYNDLNLTVIVPVDAPAGVLENYAQIESPADSSSPSKRIANANVNNSVPSSLLIVKSVQTPLHEINKGAPLNWMEFRVGLRNGASTELTDLDVIDILPFNGDGVLGSFTFTPQAGTTVNRKRIPATHFSGTFQFDSMFFDDNGECDATAIEYWFTKAAGPLDISPLHASNTKVDGTPEAIWCEGTIAGPDAGCGFTNADVTAVRTRGVGMSASGTCFLNLKFATANNMDEDIYSNTAGSNAKASDGSTLDGVLSNTVVAKVYASSIGNKVWLDNNHDGIQAVNGEPGIDGVTVNLYDNGGNLIATTTTAGGGLYNFPNLVHGNYVVEIVPLSGYLVTAQNEGGNSALDSDIDTDTNKTGVIILGEDENNLDIDAGLYAPTISGHLFDDGNGDGNINGTSISAPDGTPLYMNLVDDQGNVVAVKTLASDGTYSFDGLDGVRANTDYTLVLSTTSGNTGQPAPTADLPTNWNNADGENINSVGGGNDNEANGIISVSVGTVDVPQVDFGINHAPTADNKDEVSEPNPGGMTQVPVPTLTGADDETSSTDLIFTIIELPSNAKLYYDGVEITNPNFVVTDPSKLTVDPDDGDQTVIFKYTTTDKAGVVSPAATVTMPFTNLEISGHVFDDGNGDTNINGTPISQPDGIQLYVNLVDTMGNVVATKSVATDGTYSFETSDGVMTNSTFTIVLSTIQGTVGQAVPTAYLPTNWNNADGEQPSNTNNGSDGSPDGIMVVNVGTESLPNNDFGINHKPIANDTNRPIQLNPGGTTQVTVPVLNVTDTEDVTPSTITIETLPNNAILYYNGQPVSAGQMIANYDSSKLTVDPIDGDQTVIFTYTTTDRAGVVSDPATVTMPFTGLGISGILYNDGNGDVNVNGTSISAPDGIQLYVNLVDGQGNIIAVKPLETDGTYQFIGTDGVTANTNYTIVLSTIQGTIGNSAPAANLPENWNNTGENINSAGSGNDNNANGTISVFLGTVSVTQVDFGINHKPEAQDVRAEAQANPSGNTQYPVPTLLVTDAEDGAPAIVTIKTLPDLATGVLYYEGQPVTAGQMISNFDPSKLTVDPTDGNQIIEFTYTTTDMAGEESDPATVTIPFLGKIYVGDTVWMDNNSNGIQDPGEKGVAGVKVTLYDKDDNVVDSAITDVNGHYEFMVKEPGKYHIGFDDKYYYTELKKGGDSAKDSDVSKDNPITEDFILEWGDSDMTIDAGITPTAHIGDYFWVDKDKDGIWDANEIAVVGASVELFDANGNPVSDIHGNHSVLTDSNGRYSFDVVPGDYQVRFTLPSTGYDGYVFSSANQGSDDSIDSDVNSKGFTSTISVVAGANILTLDAGVNCGCENAPIESNGGDALGVFGMLVMMMMTLMAALFFVRKEEEQRI